MIKQITLFCRIIGGLAILAAAFLAVSPASADNHEPKLGLGNGITIEAGGKELVVPASEIDSSVDVELDFLSLWPSLHFQLPRAIGPLESGQDLSANKLVEPPNGIIFPYGQQGCAQDALGILRYGISSSALIEGLKEAGTTTLDVASFVFSVVGLPASNIIGFLSDAVEIALATGSSEEFKRVLLEKGFEKVLGLIVEKYGDQETFLKEVIGQGIEGLTEDLSELIKPKSASFETTLSLPQCNPIKLEYRMFEQHERIPRDTRPASALLLAEGNCRGGVGDFLIAAEFELWPAVRAGSFTGNKIEIRAKNPQIYIECPTRLGSIAELPAPGGFDRPIWIDDDVIKGADWEDDADNACYEQIKVQYDRWYLARHGYQKAQEDLEMAYNDVKGWEEIVEANNNNIIDVRKLEETRRKVAVLEKEFPVRDDDYYEATKSLIPLVQECVDQITHTPTNTRTKFGENLLVKLASVMREKFPQKNSDE